MGRIVCNGLVDYLGLVAQKGPVLPVSSAVRMYGTYRTTLVRAVARGDLSEIIVDGCLWCSCAEVERLLFGCRVETPKTIAASSLQVVAAGPKRQ